MRAAKVQRVAGIHQQDEPSPYRMIRFIMATLMTREAVEFGDTTTVPNAGFTKLWFGLWLLVREGPDQRERCGISPRLADKVNEIPEVRPIASDSATSGA
jgi:hypothetical protein